MRGLYVPPKNFEQQMRILAYFGFRGLSMSAAMPYLKGDKRGKVAVITFDDGYCDNIEHALPILKMFVFSATCYFVSERVGQSNLWDAERESITKPLMSWPQIAAWHAEGMEVGAHSRTHPRLTACNDQRLDEEVAGCKSDLENRCDIAVTQFSYPYGDWDERVAGAVQRAGFHAAATIIPRRADRDDDLFMLPRLAVKGGKGWRRVARNCLPELFWSLLKKSGHQRVR